jgi:uncharacterized Zn finger protein (UPF0148 family)
MEIRGQRECQACGDRWSYYELGSVTCPACGSIRSVGVDERTRHTDASVTLDLSTARSAAAEDALREAAETAEEACAAYLRARGFIDAGRLRPLDEVYIAAQELRRAAGIYRRALDPSEEDRAYLLALIQDAPEGERPPPERVPERMRPARGLGATGAVDAYLRELTTWRTEMETPPGVETPLGRLRTHRKRIDAIDGDVDPADADRLLRATVALGRYVVDGEPADREAALAALDALG